MTDDSWVYRFFEVDGPHRKMACRRRLGAGVLPSSTHGQALHALLGEAKLASAAGTFSIAQAWQGLFESQQGLWFYAGWIDQAVLHVELVRKGGGECLGAMYGRMESHPIEEGGDMLVGFWFEAEAILLELALSQDKGTFSVDLAAPSEGRLKAAMQRLAAASS